jgi:predicted PurR-regulated permease PerM
MPDSATPHSLRTQLAILAGVAVILATVLKLHLFAALVSGLLVYELVHVLAQRLRVTSLNGERAKIVAVALLATIIVSLLVAAVFGVGAMLRHGGDGLPTLLQKLAEAIDQSREKFPDWLTDALPTDPNELRASLVSLLRRHADTLQLAGRSVGRGAAHALIGAIVGAMLALRTARHITERRPISRTVAENASRLANAFRRVVFAQFWIASLNALFSWLYLGVALPLIFDIHIPQLKTLVLLTWITGMVPILGNLISNSVVVVVSLTQSTGLAISSLVFLMVIHKLEYFLNARIIGSHIRSSAWELLIAMVAMEAAFGIAGVIAAPIFYAYFKDELTRLELV